MQWYWLVRWRGARKRADQEWPRLKIQASIISLQSSKIYLHNYYGLQVGLLKLHSFSFILFSVFFHYILLINVYLYEDIATMWILQRKKKSNTLIFVHRTHTSIISTKWFFCHRWRATSWKFRRLIMIKIQEENYAWCEKLSFKRRKSKSLSLHWAIISREREWVWNTNFPCLNYK